MDVGLVRRPASHGLLDRLHHHEPHDKVVMFHRTFRPMLELAELETYASRLELVARHATQGTLGCFVETASRDGLVEITLYERWFDGNQLHCEQLARRDFDASGENVLVASAEFFAELEAWAERRNEDRETSYLSANVEEAALTERSSERRAAADELAKILESERLRP
jgi:hypothetical protein